MSDLALSLAAATVPTVPADLDLLPRRALVEVAATFGIGLTARDNAEALRTLIRTAHARLLRQREWAEHRAAREASQARRAAAHATVTDALVTHPLPRRALTDVLHAVEHAAGHWHGDTDGREARLLWAIDALVAVVNAAADPASGVLFADVLAEAEDAANTARRARIDAERHAEHVRSRLLSALRDMEGR